MADEIKKKLGEMFEERLKVEEYLRRLTSTPELPSPAIEIPNPYVDIETYKAFMSRSENEFRQEYLGDFVEPEPKVRHQQ